MEALVIQDKPKTHCEDCEGLLWDCDTCGKPCCTHCNGHVERDENGYAVAVGCGACCTDADCRRDGVHQ